MPTLFSLGQHRALVAANAELREGERLMAFLDDVHVSTLPDKTRDAHAALGEHLHTKAGICLHHGKTKIWNAQGEKPKRIDALEMEARLAQPEAVVWRGDPNLPESKQGLRVLGVPVGHHSYILSKLEQKADEHEELLRRIPAIQDVQ